MIRSIMTLGKKNSLCFDLGVKQIAERTETYMSRSKAVYDLVASADSPSIDSVIKPLHKLGFEAYVGNTELEFLQHVSGDVALREASCEADKKISDFEVGQSMRTDVFKQLQKVKALNISELDSETNRWLDKAIRDGMRNGLHLSEDVRDKIEKIKKEMASLAIDFNKNIADENTVLEFSASELEGVQHDLLDSLDRSNDNKLKVTLKYPHYVPIMRKCVNQDTRKTLEFAYNSRCKDVNLSVLHRLLELRKEFASILGYASHSDSVLETRMAKSSVKVLAFLDDLKNKVKESGRAEKEMSLMKRLRKKEAGISESEPLPAWDVSYYRNMMMEREYAVDNVEIQKYFPFDQVTAEMLSIYEELLSIRFNIDDSQPRWHEDVKCYRVTADDKLIGFFYMDMFPRDGKYSHAALFPLQPNCEYETDRTVGVCSLVCNFTKPTADKPACLTHDEVTTYFHEVS